MIKEFGITNLEITKEDISKNYNNPILRMYDDEELIGTFSILTGEVVENLDLADYNIRFAQRQIELNRDNYLEAWKDYVGVITCLSIHFCKTEFLLFLISAVLFV